MKATIEIDCTPEELRAFMGLPDVRPLQASLMKDLETRIKDTADRMAPENVSPLVVWLASAGSGDVTGWVFEISGGEVSVADGWQHGEPVDAGERWRPEALGPVVRELIKAAPPAAPVYGA